MHGSASVNVKLLLLVVACIAAESTDAQTSAPDIWACQADQIRQGAEDLDHAGFSVSAVGDWNGDGIHDILVGGMYPWDGPGKPDPGNVTLYLGTTAGGCSAAPVLRIEGRFDATSGQGECLGYDVAFIGDQDFDGKDDFVVGSPRAPLLDGVWEERGRLYFFYSTMFPSSSSTPISAECANLIIQGENIGDRLGTSIAEVGDFDGDGIDDFDWGGDGTTDIVVGAPGGQMSLQTYTGTVYVFSGFATAHAACSYTACPCSPWLVELDQNMFWLARWTGSSPVPPSGENRDRFGFSVALAGEVGDGSSVNRPDIVVGAPEFALLATAIPTGMSGNGYVRVIYGPGASDYVQFDGEADKDLFGFSVSGQAELSSPGDAHADVLIGAPGWDNSEIPLTDCGRMYAYSVFPNGLIAAPKGANGGIALGWSVQSLGRFGGASDPADYYVVGAVRFGTTSCAGTCSAPCLGGESCTGDFACGRAEVYRGADVRPVMKVTGEGFRDSCGWSFSRIGHFGGPSSLPELLLTTPRWAPTPPPPPEVLRELGRVYVVFR